MGKPQKTTTVTTCGTVILPSGVLLREIPTPLSDNYRAGSDGRIYSRTKVSSFGRIRRVDWYPMREQRPSKTHLRITLRQNGERATWAVSRLVCMAFHGMPKDATNLVLHLDGNRLNNKPDNLAWVVSGLQPSQTAEATNG